MTAHWSVIAVVTCVLAACATGTSGPRRGGGDEVLAPAVFSFGPTTSSYVSASHRTVDTEVDGRTLSERILLRYRLSAQIAQIDSSLEATLVVDTVTDATASNILPQEIERATGATFRAALSRTGLLRNFPADANSSPLFVQLTNQLREFFPTVPADGMTAGSVWSDTTEVPRRQGGAVLTVRRVTQYRAGEWVEGDTTATLTVLWKREYQVSGAGEQLGQPFTLSGSGITTGASSFSAAGLYLGSVSQDELISEIQIASMGATMRLRQSQSDTVRIVLR